MPKNRTRRICNDCGSEMEWRPIAGRWICIQCMMPTKPYTWECEIDIDDKITLWIYEAFQSVNASDMDS